MINETKVVLSEKAIQEIVAKHLNSKMMIGEKRFKPADVKIFVHATIVRIVATKTEET